MGRSTGRYVLVAFALFGSLWAGWVYGQEAPVTDDGWRQAAPGYEWQFPRDHGSHPDYRIEWWYYTGNLESADARRFRYQVTFFRIGVDPAPENPSSWAVRDLFMAHLAITDFRTGRQVVAERLNRAGVGWAGARSDVLEVWNGDWRVEGDGETHRLDARDRTLGVELRLDPGRGITLHGDEGLSQKGAEAGNASHYYSLTRMPTVGRLWLDDAWVEVSGSSWMDHEFGTSFLESSQVGWDWFSLQLDDGADLMLFRIRRADGSVDPHSAGTWVEPTGTVSRLDATDMYLRPGRRWTSPMSGAEYPVSWTVEVVELGLRLDVLATVDAQELDTSASTGVTYWEGAVSAVGRLRDREVRGRGYLEMTGYVGRPMSEMFR